VNKPILMGVTPGRKCTGFVWALLADGTGSRVNRQAPTRRLTKRKKTKRANRTDRGGAAGRLLGSRVAPRSAADGPFKCNGIEINCSRRRPASAARPGKPGPGIFQPKSEAPPIECSVDEGRAGAATGGGDGSLANSVSAKGGRARAGDDDGTAIDGPTNSTPLGAVGAGDGAVVTGARGRGRARRSKS